MQIGRFFTLAELTYSGTAIQYGLANTPGPVEIDNLTRLTLNVLDPLRELVGPIKVNSAYRAPKVNAAVGGVRTSQHVAGQAADITVTGLTPYQLIDCIKWLRLPVDQCINEFGRWVHVSYGPRHRRQYFDIK